MGSASPAQRPDGVAVVKNVLGGERYRDSGRAGAQLLPGFRQDPALGRGHVLMLAFKGHLPALRTGYEADPQRAMRRPLQSFLWDHAPRILFGAVFEML